MSPDTTLRPPRRTAPCSPRAFRAWVVLALVLLFLPTCSAQAPTPTPSPTPTEFSPVGSSVQSQPTGAPSNESELVEIGVENYTMVMFNDTGTPTIGASAHLGAPTYTLKPDLDVVVAVLNKTRPVVVLQFNYSTPSVGFVFNLFRASGDFKVPRILVSAPKQSDYYYYYPGNAHPDRRSGGTAFGGYNVRNMDTWEVQWDQGFSNWTYGYSPNQQTVDTEPVQPSILVGLGISDDILFDPDQVGDGSIALVAVMSANLTSGSMNADFVVNSGLSDLYPFVGDTTGTEAVVFSPILYKDAIEQPSYPNYTLPGAELLTDNWKTILDTTPQNSSSALDSNFPFGREYVDMIAIPTDLSPIVLGLQNSPWAILECGLKLEGKGEYREPTWNDTRWAWIGGEQGFRQSTLWTDLKPNTNYTVWAVASDGTMSQPVWFVTKSADFECSLALPNDICPSVAYAVPFPKDAQTNVATIPAAMNDTLLWSLGNFSTALSANGLACGRDMYSYVSSCLDCYNAYRDWLCHTLLPRCADPNAPAFQNVKGRNAPTAAITVPRTTDSPRNGVNQTNYDITINYTEMLPCLDMCTKVERACPNTLGWTCPHRNFNAAKSYAYIGKDTKHNDGNKRTGYPSQDQWGNRWCNGG